MNISLTKAQFFLLLFIFQTGIVYIAFQTPLISSSKNSSWLIFIVASVIHYGLLLFFERYHSYFYLNVFFRWVYQIYWLLLTAAFIAYMSYVLASWVLPQTPEWIVVVIIVVLSLYANLSRPETVINIGVMLIPIIFLFVTFLMLAIPDLTWSNLFPIEWKHTKQIGAGLIHSIYAYFGIEMYLIYRPFLQKDLQVKGKPLLMYQLVIFVFYFISVLFTQMFFSIEEINLIPEPIMYILKSQEVTFVKRLDIFFVYIWLSWSIVTVMIFGLSFRMLHFVKKKQHPNSRIIVYHIFLAILPLFVIHFRSIELIKNSLHYVFIFFTFLLPIVIIGWNKWRGKSVS
ncbi:GerAB/ArcD/ProY family transporter [Lysinibacillus sphaericus]|uniref:Spore germination protein n=3 Tax=Lysinibacillus TaxID=400634 RepID=B1HME5_LYSSC|nr:MULTISPECIES: GerAB/ArcD/ProY family transporter [Lysinibacillus]MBE5083309.1 GerAB/ArcD/ProY family transporter [Bacillus thuringiensis]ACA40311.1 spore germination protein [Lysinibacillus sphaericus C3-41]AMO33649.1 spore gernimation protein [Lysinibacillus sphaericus]AMR91244.1 spore gernimation protein [Lysinibacillus sphaericus]ANA45292.1 spore gernimation protein [Lysinibacillus sphaericus]